MKQTLLVLLALLIVSLSVSAQTPITHVVLSDGQSLRVTAMDANLDRTEIRGWESELQVFTPAFNERIRLWTAAVSCIVVVENDRVSQIHLRTSSVPRIPSNGYLLVGHGVPMEIFFQQMKVGETVKLEERKPQTPNPKPQALVTMDYHAFAISGIDRGRGVDELVIYTPDFGTRTLTNEWGVEFVVEDDFVVEIRAMGNKQDSLIPFDGYVISAHGSMARELTERIYIGDYVELSEEF